MAQTLPEPLRSVLLTVSPALVRYTEASLLGEVWTRPGLSARDRSLVTLAALIARNQINAQPYYINLALEQGALPAELSEIITHLAFYVGFPNAIAAATNASPVFAQRHVNPDALPAAQPQLLALDDAADVERATRVEQQLGPTLRTLAHDTNDVLFHDLWLRPDLAPRDRSLVTVSALVASGQVAQISFHLNRAMDNGLTETEAAETIAHLAFYAGWPYAVSAAAVAKDVFERRPR